MLIFAAIGCFLLFLPFVYFASREQEEDRRMLARFAMLRSNGGVGLISEKKAELLKGADQQPAGWQSRIADQVGRLLHLDDLLLAANSPKSAWEVLRSASVAALAAVIILLLVSRNPILLLVSGLSSGCFPWLRLKWRARQRLAAMNKVLPQVLDTIARALRAGHSLPAALGILAEEAAEPARTAFGDIFQKQKFGLPLRDALLELVRRFPSNDLKVLVTAILVQRDTGGNLVQILERTSTVIRDRLKLQGDVRVHTAQGRLTGWILCLLPVLMLLLLLVTNPSYPKVLLDDPLGRKLLYGGGFLLALGAYLIHRIVKTIEV